MGGDYHLANFDPATQTLIQAKSGTLYDRSLVQPQYNNFAPRIGLAYQPAPKTVIRSAYGISYVQFNRLGGENLLAYNGPNIVDATIDQTPDLPLCSANSAPHHLLPYHAAGLSREFRRARKLQSAGGAGTLISRRIIPTGYVQSWHFTCTAGDHANAGDRRGLRRQPRYASDDSGGLQSGSPQSSRTKSCRCRRGGRIQNFSTIEVAYGAGESSYNALQLKAEKRYAAGLYLLNSFTWSKAIDNASGHLEATNGDNSRVNIRDLRNEKGPSGYDQPFNDTTSVIYDLPYGNGRRFGSNTPYAMQAILGGWQFSAIDTAASGMPINLSYSPTSQFQVSGRPRTALMLSAIR